MRGVAFSRYHVRFGSKANILRCPGHVRFIRFTAVEPQEGDAVSCGKAADDQCHDCYLLLPTGDYTVAMGGGAVRRKHTENA